jgi:hypothetical protein
MSRMPGERFSGLYVQHEDPAPDSGRARHRVGALFGEAVFNDRTELLARYLGQELGVPVPGDGKYASHWQQFIRECRTSDFLDTVTLVYRYLYWHVSDGIADWWRDAVRHIFTEQNLAYEIDDFGGVHPVVDREFQKNRASAVAALQPHRYQNVRDLLESASSSLGAKPPNYKLAWRATFSAVEGLFGLMFPYVRLTADEIERRLQPLVQGAYEGDATAQQAAQSMLAVFKEWVEASRNYIHQPGNAEPAQPPADVAVLAISCGASLLRWLAGLDEDRQRELDGGTSAASDQR